MESLFDPAPVTPDSKASNPFASPSGIIGTFIMRCRDEGLLMASGFVSFSQPDPVSQVRQRAYYLYGQIRSCWEHLSSVQMSGMGSEVPVIEEMLARYDLRHVIIIVILISLLNLGSLSLNNT